MFSVIYNRCFENQNGVICVLYGGAANTNVIFIGFIDPESAIFCILGEYTNNYTVFAFIP
jgi:hypothetical protein